MLTRRSMLRAFAIGAPAAVVATAVGLPKVAARPGLSFAALNEASLAARLFPLSSLSALSANMGSIEMGQIITPGFDGRLPGFVMDLQQGHMTVICDENERRSAKRDWLDLSADHANDYGDDESDADE
ncbi:MAG: hypothetical protein DI607_05880 [Sphingomonas hengshuiensis]|nr:MAG: hypothetical protein DI607_05880 [Sphingomonas hengshuiensis]